MTPARQPHPKRCETCYYPHQMKDESGEWKRCPIAKCELSFERLSLIDIVGCASHTSPPAPDEKCPYWGIEHSDGVEWVCSRAPAAAKTPQECENRNCLECPLWEPCHIMEDMPMCAKATYDGVRKNAAKAAREQVLGLARDMYSLMMCVEKTNTDEFMEYYAERMRGLEEQYESLRAQHQGGVSE